jgi:hypothetical protein
MSNLKTFFEIFEEVEKAKNKKEKIAVLHANSSSHLKEMLSIAFNPKLKWLVPEGTPPYDTPQEDPNVLRQRLYQEMRMLQHFTNATPYPNMKDSKRQQLFIDLIKTIHQDDAKLICFIKDNRKLPQKTVTKALVEEAFPKLAAKWK